MWTCVFCGLSSGYWANLIAGRSRCSAALVRHCARAIYSCACCRASLCVWCRDLRLGLGWVGFSALGVRGRRRSLCLARSRLLLLRPDTPPRFAAAARALFIALASSRLVTSTCSEGSPRTSPTLIRLEVAFARLRLLASLLLFLVLRSIASVRYVGRVFSLTLKLTLFRLPVPRPRPGN